MKFQTKKVLSSTIFYLLVICSFAQEVSQMHQFFSMNPMIKRDPLFQTVQNNIQRRVSNTEIGFNENISNRIIKELRTSIRGIGANVYLDKNDSLRIVAYIKKDTVVKVKLPPPTQVQDLVDSTIYYSEFLIREFIAKKFRRPANSTSPEGQLIILTLGRIVEGETGLQYTQSTTYDDLVRYFITTYKSQLEDYIDIVMRESQFLSTLDNVKRIELVNRINGELQAFLSSKRDQLLQYLDIVESELGEFKEKVNKGLVAANTGLSVSSDEGNLGGGIYVSLKSEKSIKSKQFEIGIFINGAGEVFQSDADSVTLSMDNNQVANDTTVVVDDNLEKPFLAGVALKYQLSPRFQTNLLFTMYQVRGDNFNTSTSMELGGGVLYNTQGNMTLGLAAFHHFFDEEIMAGDIKTGEEQESVWSVGLSFQNNIPGSPLIMIGFTKEKNKDPIPSIQVSYPITLNR